MTDRGTLENSESLRLARLFLGATVDLVIDRPYGSRHPRCGFRYFANYGYVPLTRAPDGQELDAYYLGPSEPLVFARGRCVAIVHRLYDDDDKLVVVPPGSPVPADAAIDAAVAFQETAGHYVLVRSRPATAGRVPIGRADTG
ncbi:inorganic diphosphatase [Nocardia gamkensis]|uniref:inorganic diphosphatase n=1 Tax=Nocardia gamkensis TaxID=352869 RepID=UPI0037C69BE5